MIKGLIAVDELLSVGAAIAQEDQAIQGAAATPQAPLIGRANVTRPTSVDWRIYCLITSLGRVDKMETRN